MSFHLNMEWINAIVAFLWGAFVGAVTIHNVYRGRAASRELQRQKDYGHPPRLEPCTCGGADSLCPYCGGETITCTGMVRGLPPDPLEPSLSENIQGPAVVEQRKAEPAD